MNTKDCFEQYAAQKAEIIQIMAEISRLTDKPTHLAQDSVMASPAHEPYQNRPIPVCGNVQGAAVQRELQRLVKRYGDMLVDLYRRRNTAEDFLQTVPSATDRVILRGYYIDGKSWRDVAAELTENSGQEYNENRVKKRAHRFFEKNL